MHRVIIGGNLEESGVQETRVISAIPDTRISVCEKYRPKETDKGKSNFHYLSKLIIVGIKYTR